MLQVARGARPRARLRGVGAGRIELHDPLPRLHSLVELPLPGQRGALVIQRARVLGIEAQYALEGFECLRGPPVLQQRPAERGARLELVGIGLQ